MAKKKKEARSQQASVDPTTGRMTSEIKLTPDKTGQSSVPGPSRWGAPANDVHSPPVKEK